MVYQDHPDASAVRYRDDNDVDAEFGEQIEMPQVVSSSPRRLCSPRCKIVLVVCLLVAAVVVYSSKGGDIVGRPLFSGDKKGSTQGGVRGSSSDDINVGEYYDIEELSGVDSTATEVVSAPSETTETVSEESAKNDECIDDPTFMIHDNKQHTCDTYIAHVGRPQLHKVRCNQSIGEFNKETQAYDIHNSPDEIRDTDLLLKDFCRKSCDFCDGMDSNAGDSQQQKPDEMKEPEVVITPESGPSTSSEENTPEIPNDVLSNAQDEGYANKEDELQQQPTATAITEATAPEEDTTPEIPEKPLGKIESQQTDTSSIEEEEEEEEAATPVIPIEPEPAEEITTQQIETEDLQEPAGVENMAAKDEEDATYNNEDEIPLDSTQIEQQEQQQPEGQIQNEEEEDAVADNNPPPPPPPAVDVASPPTSSGSSLFGG